MTRLTRRGLLRTGGAGVLALAAGKTVDNVALGYGVVGGGTNLREQELGPLLSERRSLAGEVVTADATYGIDGGTLRVDRGTDSRAYSFENGASDAPGDGEDRALFEDLRGLEDESTYEFHTLEGFLERLDGTTPRALATEALRGGVSDPVEPSVVNRFAGVPPADSVGLLSGLKRGFREHGYYDVPRYVGGSVQDNVLRGAVDLRAPFEGPTDFETLIEEERTGLFCGEMTVRAIEALHSVPATEQDPPLAAFWVRDRRHKHVYNGLASVVRDGPSLAVPVTFVDYTDSTLADDLWVRSIAGEMLCAYDRRHRADEIGWGV
ncbi:hypothetical protein [Halalkalicoccus tibetensis]|uniref:Uncharacterized protein n=1 Tax=Halalkalicoccus tibetensis TaxID=175632 RepID=A0ABD5V4V3_9EURY